ncbi:MAG: hypothetical protein M8861_07855 [marine benthic group bacterium]|nr:hypothetical protein [Gemmatimonadota bacterium]
MRWQIPLVLTLALFAAVSCDQQPTEPLENEATAPVMNFLNGPEMAGVVTRGDSDFLILFDYTRDETEKEGEPWMVFMGMGIDDYHATCGSGFDNAWDQQAVQDALVLDLAQEMGVTVFPFSEFFGNYMSAPMGADPVWYASCETTRIASGTAHGIKNATPAGKQYKVHGRIEYMGETYRLNWVTKLFGKDGSMRTMRIW